MCVPNPIVDSELRILIENIEECQMLIEKHWRTSTRTYLMFLELYDTSREHTHLISCARDVYALVRDIQDHCIIFLLFYTREL